MKCVIFCIITLCILKIINTSPLPTSVEKSTKNPIINNQNSYNNKTISDLVQKQTDVVKQIVAIQQQDIKKDHPLLNKHGTQDKEPLTSKTEELTPEELKIKCQHFYKLFNSTKYQGRPSTQSPFGSNIRPVYLKDRIKASTTTQSPIRNYNGFYVTQPSTRKAVTQSQTLPQNIKLIKLEPVILQKTILNDGRIIYYWHKSLPSSVQYPQSQSLYNMNQARFENRETYQQPSNYPATYYYPSQYYNTLSSTTSTTTTTTPSSSGLSISNYFPFYWSSGSNDEAAPSSSTTESTTQTPTTSTTTTTTTTTQKPATDSTDDLLYANQLRFVVPVPYDDPDNVTKYVWDFDQFAYYPKQLQPSTVKVEVPYVPSFHMIKALTIPNKYIEPNTDTVYNNNYQKATNYQYGKKK